MEESTLKNMNETLDRIEAIMEDMNNKLSRMVEEIDKYRNETPSNRTMTTTYDGDIMFKYKQNGK